MNVWVIVVAAGEGTRAQTRGHKLWWQAGGRPTLAWTIGRFLDPQWAGVVVVRAQDMGIVGAWLQRLEAQGWSATPGGPTRQDSVRAGLGAIRARGGQDQDIVLIHDGARPFVNAALIARVIAGVAQFNAAVAVVPIVDTVKQIQAGGRISATLARDHLGLAQTPQGFRLGLIERAYRELAANAVTDDAQAVERLGVAVAAVAGEPGNVKLTTAEDYEWYAWRIAQLALTEADGGH